MLEPAPVPEDEIRLTRFSHGAGCACKLSPAELRTVLGLVQGLDPPADLNASPEFRRHLAEVFVRRALEECGIA